MPTVRTPDWSKPMGFYPSLPGYHNLKCAMYVRMCLTSFPSMAPGDQPSLTSDRRSSSGTITTPMAPSFCAGPYPEGKTAKALPTRGERGPSVLRAYKTRIFLKAKSQRTPLPAWKSMRHRRHHYTTLTNASTGLRR